MEALRHTLAGAFICALIYNVSSTADGFNGFMYAQLGLVHM